MALVCTIPDTERVARRRTVLETLAQARSVHEVEDGIGFRFAGTDDIARELLELALAERTCCADFQYLIAFDPRHGAIEFRIRASGALVRPLKDMYLAFNSKAVIDE